jgi:hypothetical protein
MNKELENKLVALKVQYAAEGFVIEGISGSFARDEETESSDIDLVYTLDDPAGFARRYGGFGAFGKIAQIREELGAQLGRKVDLIALTGLNEVGRKHIAGKMRRVG